MQRRTFIKYNTLAAISFMPLFSNPHNHHITHANHHQHNMQNTPIDTSFITLENEKIALLNDKNFPQNNTHKELPLLSNQNKQKGVFEAIIEIREMDIEIIKNKKTKCYVYNDGNKKIQSRVAPKIEVYEGDRVKIWVKNRLKSPTTIHWHGLPVPPLEDGNPMDIIPANGDRIYSFQLPDNCAGTYWYHPHPHNITGKQVYMGLAGAFVVKSRNDPLDKFIESDWFITDLRLDSKAQIPPNTLADWLDGREGEFVLINGEYKPKITIDSMQRIRIYNACSARYLNLEIQGAKFIIVGTDGGLIEKPIVKQKLFISPASRLEVFIKNDKKGSFNLISHFYDRDKMIPKSEPKELRLATIELNAIFNQNEIPNTLRILPIHKHITQESPTPKNPIQQLEITMSEDHSKMHNLTKKDKKSIRENLASMFLMNNKTFDMNRIDLRVDIGIVHDIIVTNKSHMDHPFHIHGTQFEVIERKLGSVNEKIEFRALQDTINVRPNEVIRLRMRQDFKGVRMFHCHILEHEDLGMMGNLLVD